MVLAEEPELEAVGCEIAWAWLVHVMVLPGQCFFPQLKRTLESKLFCRVDVSI